MLLTFLLLAISVSIDSLGIGLTYGLKNTTISKIAKLILFFISLTITTMSLYIGDLISSIFPDIITKIIGCSILITMGVFVILQSFKKDDFTQKKELSKEPTIHEFFIKFLGITIQIIKNPISSDFDHSNHIDAKEAIYLGIALSIDSLCVGIGSSIIGFSSFVFPIFVASFQLLFLSIGSYLGKKIQKQFFLPNQIWNLLSGLLLIGIGITKFMI